MDRIKVNLLHNTPSSVLLNAVSKPYKNEKVTLELARKIGVVNKHGSTLEHINFNFEILGISRLCLQELARHRLSSFTVESTRFTLNKLLNDENKNVIDDYYVIPTNLNLDEEISLRDYLLSNLETLDSFLKKDKTKNDKLKYYLNESWRVNLTWSINLRSLINFLDLREDKNAHFEIKYLASLVRQEVDKTEYKPFIIGGK